MRVSRLIATAALLAVASAEVDRKELATKLARLMSAPGPLGWSADGHMATANIATSVSRTGKSLRFGDISRVYWGSSGVFRQIHLFKCMFVCSYWHYPRRCVAFCVV
jgi:hypothetical protein